MIHLLIPRLPRRADSSSWRLRRFLSAAPMITRGSPAASTLIYMVIYFAAAFPSSDARRAITEYNSSPQVHPIGQLDRRSGLARVCGFPLKGPTPHAPADYTRESDSANARWLRASSLLSIFLLAVPLVFIIREIN